VEERPKFTNGATELTEDERRRGFDGRPALQAG